MLLDGDNVLNVHITVVFARKCTIQDHTINLKNIHAVVNEHMSLAVWLKVSIFSWDARSYKE